MLLGVWRKSMSLWEIEGGENKREEREGTQVGECTEKKLGEETKLLGGRRKLMPLSEVEHSEDT